MTTIRTLRANHRALWLAALALGLGASPAGAGHVVVYDQCAGTQNGTATVALSLSLPPGSTVVGGLYGETGAAQATGAVNSSGIVELHFPDSDDRSFYEWAAHDDAAPDHVIASGGLAPDAPPCSGSQLRPAPAQVEDPQPEPTPAEEPEPDPEPTPEEEPSPPVDEPVDAGTGLTPPATAGDLQPVLPPPPPVSQPPPATAPRSDDAPADVSEPDDPPTSLDPPGLALPPTVTNGADDIGGDVHTGLLVLARPDDAQAASSSPSATADPGQWLLFISGTLLVLWLSPLTARTAPLSVSADQLINKRHRAPNPERERRHPWL